MDSVNMDLREKGLSGEETQNGGNWSETSTAHRDHSTVM